MAVVARRNAGGMRRFHHWFGRPVLTISRQKLATREQELPRT